MTYGARIWIDDDGMHVEFGKGEHGFQLADLVEGAHAPKCKDHLCDGCVPLNECVICQRPEFEHGEGYE